MASKEIDRPIAQAKSAALQNPQLDLRKLLISVVFQHFSDRPIGRHLAAWIATGLVFGMFLAPEFSLIGLFAFGLSGIILSLGLAVVTYPVSDDYRLTMGAGLLGLLATPLFWIFGPSEIREFAPAFGTLVGAMFGSTALLWLAPTRAAFRAVIAITKK